jgi:hypothetical protein
MVDVVIGLRVEPVTAHRERSGPDAKGQMKVLLHVSSVRKQWRSADCQRFQRALVGHPCVGHSYWR